MQKMKSLEGRSRTFVTMAAQFDMHATRILNAPQCFQNWRKVHFTFAEHEMLVNATPHILDVDIDDPGSPKSDLLLDR